MKEMRDVHDLAATYYHSTDAKSPHQQAILFLAQLVCVLYNKSTIVADLDIFLQEADLRKIREEYYETRMGIQPNVITSIDTYALGLALSSKEPKLLV